MSERTTVGWKEWARMIAPMIVAPVLAAVATVAVLQSRVESIKEKVDKLDVTIEREIGSLESSLKDVKAEVGAITTSSARYDERIQTLQRALEDLRSESRDELGALRERVHNNEVRIRVTERNR